MTVTWTKTAVILVDHGSVRAEANRLLEDVAEAARRARPGVAVYVAHMELAEPTIEQAFDRAVADGARHVIVHPYFLAPGRHSQSDIPRMAAEAAARHGGVSFAVTEPLGLDERMIQLVWDRIDQARTRA